MLDGTYGYHHVLENKAAYAHEKTNKDLIYHSIRNKTFKQYFIIYDIQ